MKSSEVLALRHPDMQAAIWQAERGRGGRQVAPIIPCSSDCWSRAPVRATPADPEVRGSRVWLEPGRPSMITLTSTRHLGADNSRDDPDEQRPGCDPILEARRTGGVGVDMDGAHVAGHGRESVEQGRRDLQRSRGLVTGSSVLERPVRDQAWRSWPVAGRPRSSGRSPLHT